MQLKRTVSPVTRRRFLIFCGGVGAAGIAAGATQVHWSDLVSAAAKTPLDPAAGVLVVVTLYGGNDGSIPSSRPVIPPTSRPAASSRTRHLTCWISVRALG